MGQEMAVAKSQSFFGEEEEWELVFDGIPTALERTDLMFAIVRFLKLPDNEERQLLRKVDRGEDVLILAGGPFEKMSDLKQQFIERGVQGFHLVVR